MAVCRGKVAEGLDFADNNGRAVLITGKNEIYKIISCLKYILQDFHIHHSKTREWS